MSDLHLRRGKIKVSREFVTGKGITNNAMRALFSVFYPFGIETIHMWNPFDQLMYYGCSDLFEPLQEGVVIPEYEITFKHDAAGNVNIESVKRLP